jgi:hypothetical protein
MTAAYLACAAHLVVSKCPDKMRETFEQTQQLMKTFIIAEVGINHNGDIKIARQLIDLAK